MAMFDSTIEDVAGRFGLGSKTAPLLREVMNLMTDSPGGMGGFINKFKSAGLGSQVASWLGRTDGAALTAPQVEKALGSTTLSGIAGRLGLGGSAVATAIGYVVPKLTGQLTPVGSCQPASRLRFQRSSARPYKRQRSGSSKWHQRP